jgi:hypothetical protein
MKNWKEGRKDRAGRGSSYKNEKFLIELWWHLSRRTRTKKRMCDGLHLIFRK